MTLLRKGKLTTNMNFRLLRLPTIIALLCIFLVATHAPAAGDPLPSWNDGPAKQAIVTFVDKVTDKPGPNYVEPEDRIATFDQDGTLGNSTGDQQMLEWTQAGDGARLMMLILHDDPEREYAYGPANGLSDSKVGTFSQALYDEAKSRDWNVISMKKDWNRVFSFDK